MLFEEALDIIKPQRLLDPKQEIELLQLAGRRIQERFGLLRRQPRREALRRHLILLTQRDQRITGSGQLPGAVQHPLKHLIKLEALVDAQRGITKPRQPRTKRLHLAPHIASPAHRATPAAQPTSCPSARRTRPTRTSQQIYSTNRQAHSRIIHRAGCRQVKRSCGRPLSKRRTRPSKSMKSQASERGHL